MFFGPEGECVLTGGHGAGSGISDAISPVGMLPVMVGDA